MFLFLQFFDWFIVWGFTSQSRIFLSYDDVSNLTMNYFKFWPILGTQGHWKIRLPYCLWLLPRTRDNTPDAKMFGSETVTTRLNDLGLFEGSNPNLSHARWTLYQLDHRGGFILWQAGKTSLNRIHSFKPPVQLLTEYL